MAWWRRRAQRSPDRPTGEETGKGGSGGGPGRADRGEGPERPAGTEGALPGLGTLFRDGEAAAQRDTGGLYASILDLGPALPANFRLYTRFTRRMRFLDLPETLSDGATAALPEIPPGPLRPYDLILAWDLLDRLPPEGRPDLISRLVQVSAPGTSLHILARASGDSLAPPLRFRLLREDRVRREPTGPPVPVRPPILPAELERLISPFQVTRAFTLKGGLREYVARLPQG